MALTVTLFISHDIGKPLHPLTANMLPCTRGELQASTYMFMLLSRAYSSVSFSICVDTLVCTMWDGM
jgi:hypothetical protein